MSDDDTTRMIQDVLADYLDDSPDRLTLAEIKLKYDLTQPMLKQIVELADLGPRARIERDPTPSDEVLAAAAAYVEEGISAMRAAEEHGASYKDLLKHLRRKGLTRPRDRKVIPEAAIQDYLGGGIVKVILRQYKAKDGRRIWPTEFYAELRARGYETRADARYRREQEIKESWTE